MRLLPPCVKKPPSPLSTAMALGSLLLTAVGEAAAFEPFEMSDQGCVGGYSGRNCPKYWHVTKGPGWEGQRANWDDARGVRIMCSPSCTDKNKPKVCSLIMAFHGIYSNPGEQEWLMLGSTTSGTGTTFSESKADGGPYCISFHKSAADAWQYHCIGSDHDHLTSFVDFALANFPIDRQAVNLHGFSSGGIQIHNMMDTHCSIEGKIAAACSYGSGNVGAPPTTKAAYLLVHGTHDGVVIYRNLWDKKRAIMSCCDYEWDGVCVNPDYYLLYAEGLGAAIATLRGYQGEIIGGTHPSPSKTLGLVDDNLEKCNGRIAKCTIPSDQPNPWNEGFTCPSEAGMETDVLEYPVDPASGAGPVQVWRINTWNHDYPNRRIDTWGPTIFFMKLRKFFYNNRGIKSYRGRRSVERLNKPRADGSYDKRLCSNPDYLAQDPVQLFVRRGWNNDMTPEICERLCLENYQCKDAFYFDWTNYAPDSIACQIFYERTPCLATKDGSGAVDAIHFRGYTTLEPTESPSSSGPVQPTFPPPTGFPTVFPTPRKGMCRSSHPLVPSNYAGHSCLTNLGDSNSGMTEEECKDLGGTWVSYDCGIANDYWLSVTDSELKSMFSDWWVPKCCEKNHDGMCDFASQLQKSNLAGYHCDGGTEDGGDSNFGTTEVGCKGGGGSWLPYDCATANDYWKTQNEEYKGYFSEVWVPKCCGESSMKPTEQPSVAPTTESVGCPANCAVPNCIWLGQDGPGWDPSWEGDDGSPTSNGFCTGWCQTFDDSGLHLCGNTDWHKTGVNCFTKECREAAENPLLPEEDRLPSTGLCKEVEAMSGHRLWGRGITECTDTNMPHPTDEHKCTVRQVMNGDSVINPERTCQGFCNYYGLTCVNGYDDGEDRCLYGGDGIGCNDILGVGSIGGPTPDHVCVCGKETQTQAPSVIASTLEPSTMPSEAPSAVHSEAPSAVPSEAPSAVLSKAPSAMPSEASSVAPSHLPSEPPSKPKLVCKDNKDIILFNKKCKKLAKGNKKKKKNCKKWDATGRLVKNHCPKSCENCAKLCQDDKGRIVIKGKTYKCSQLTNDQCALVIKIKKKKKQEKRQVREICRKRCNFCSSM